MNKFFTHRSKSQNVYKKFWQEDSKKKIIKPTLSRYSFRKKFRRKVKKNKHIRSKSMFFDFSTEIEKLPPNFKNQNSLLDYLTNAFLNIRKDYILRMKAIRRKVTSIYVFQISHGEIIH
jgi:hypothetical protein